MENELPEGAIEVVLDEDTRATGPAPASGTDTDGNTQGGSGQVGNRTGFEQRIAQLTARRHDAERGENEQRDRADRLEAELARHRAQLDALEKRQNSTEGNVLADYAARERAIQLHDIDGKVGRLAADKANALETSDFQKASAIDVEIAQALIEKRELEQALANPGSRSQQQQAPAQEAPPQDPKLSAFQARNQDWWNKDPGKTARAWELHAELKRSNPTIIGTDEYWRMIEDHGRGNGNGRAAMPPLSNGGAATAGNGGQRATNRVVLTREQADTARGLRLTPEQYARGLLEAQQKGEIPVGRY